jgi:hypothetical protein
MVPEVCGANNSWEKFRTHELITKAISPQQKK